MAEDFDYFHFFDAFDFFGEVADFFGKFEFEMAFGFGEMMDFFN